MQAGLLSGRRPTKEEEGGSAPRAGPDDDDDWVHTLPTCGTQGVLR